MIQNDSEHIRTHPPKSTNHKGRLQKGGKEQKLQQSQEMTNQMTRESPYLSITTLDVNGLNSPIKK